MMRQVCAFCAILCLTTLISHAQPADTPDIPGDTFITLDSVVEGTITELAVFDAWHLSLNEGDIITVTMESFENLMPRLGILNPNRTPVYVNDQEEGRPERNETLQTRYRAEMTGVHTIITSRYGAHLGTTTGSYRLSVDFFGRARERVNTAVETEFRCGEFLATTALLFEFSDEAPLPVNYQAGDFIELYRITVYGLDDFYPFIRADSKTEEARLDCTRDALRMAGSVYTLPNSAAVTITEADLDHAAQLSLRNSSPNQRYGELRVTLGSLDGRHGRYMVALEGLSLETADDVDSLLVRLGPLARHSSLMIYMVGATDNRLDPVLEVRDAQENLIVQCDDAGRRGCETAPSFEGAGMQIALPNAPLIRGDRFDAGVLLTPGTSQELFITMQSRDHATSGDYTLIFIGELPTTTGQ